MCYKSFEDVFGGTEEDQYFAKNVKWAIPFVKKMEKIEPLVRFQIFIERTFYESIFTFIKVFITILLIIPTLPNLIDFILVNLLQVYTYVYFILFKYYSQYAEFITRNHKTYLQSPFIFYY